MAKYVGRYVLRGELRAGQRGSFDVLGDDQRDRVGAEPSAATRREERIVGSATTFIKPAAQHRHNPGRERRRTLLAALSETANVRTDPEVHVAASEPGELRDPQAGLDRERQERVVAPTEPARPIRSSQQRIDLTWLEEGDESPLEASRRNGEDALDRRGVLGMAQRRVAK